MPPRSRARPQETVQDPSQREDVELVAQYLAGDELAFNKIHAKYRQKLTGFIRVIINDASRAEDLVQEVFLRVFRNLKKYDPKRRFSTWIHVIAKNLSLNEIRNRKKRPAYTFSEFGEEFEERFLEDLEDKTSHPERLMNQREAKTTLRLALSEVPDRRRKIFELRKIDGRTIEETANTMMCPTGTIKSNVSRAIEDMAPLVRRRMA